MTYNPRNTHIPQGTYLSDIISKLVPDTYTIVEKYANIKLASILHQHAKGYVGEGPRHLADYGTAERFHKDITGGVSDMHDKAVSFLMYQQFLDENNPNNNIPQIKYSDKPHDMVMEYFRIFNFLKDLTSEKLFDISLKVKEKIINDFELSKSNKLFKEFDKSIGGYVWSNYLSLASNTDFVDSTGLKNLERF